MANLYGKDPSGSILKRWGSSSRTAKRVENNLGIIWDTNVSKVKKVRREELDELDKYYECTQYEHLLEWDEAAARACTDGEFIGVRKRAPRINYAFAKTLMSRIASKIVGEKTMPYFMVEEDPETTDFIQALLKWADFDAKVPEPIRRLLNTGSVFMRFSIMGGVLKLEHFLSKYCYPEFDDAGSLTELRVQYVWTDYDDVDERGKPKEKWYRLDLGEQSDILFDNPEYHPTAMPEFVEVARVDHGLGFVQGTWLRTCEDKHEPDGYGMTEDLEDFIDEINYSMSQSSQAVSYNQEPQLSISGLDAEEMDHIIRSSSKALNLGRDGKAAFLESNLGGVQVAEEFRTAVRLGIQEVARVVLLDPEKIVGSAQSGKAMEVLHGPMLDLIHELRPVIEKSLVELITKMALATLIMNKRGEELTISIPEGWQPSSLDLKVEWPEVFPMTIEDLQKKVATGASAAASRIISEESVTRWLAKDFDIEDVEAEIARIKAQPIANPFGGF
jgi:hypothetical protein